MRLFIAIPLEGAALDAALSAQAAFRKGGVRGNYTKPENLHLTLAFIGEVPDARDAIDAVRAVPFEPMELRLSGVGAFGDLWWLGLERSEPLETYVRRLRRALAEAGIPFDRKRFAPHVTLVRRAQPGAQGMPGIAVPAASMVADRARVMRSDRGRDGMIYTEIG